jgi:putative nucleotidyltransferase-like protein
MASAAVHPELQLLFACARINPDLEQVQILASQEIDWTRLATVTEFHGLAPLVLRNLQAADVLIPTGAATTLAKWNAATVRQNLYLTSELLRVHAELKERGIEALPLKGASIASEIYGDLGLRPFSDIDLLVRREQIQQAESAVSELGYVPEFTIPPQHRERWMKQQCEVTFRRSGTIRLELHWDISHPHFALDTGVEDFWGRLSTVRIGDATLPALSSTDLLFTLIVHGTRHAWSRMMWAVDVAELLRRSPAIDWETFWQNAESRGAARMMATGIELVRRAFGVSVPGEFAGRAHGDLLADNLAEQVMAHWSKGFEALQADELEPTALWRHRWILHTREDRAQRWSYARRLVTMTGEEEFGAVRLPGMFSPLYKVVRFWNIFRKARPRTRTATPQSRS